jgi:glutathione S-transferase
MMPSVELYTFAISHFSEKVRWVLDLEGILYEEKQLLPGLHPFTTRRLAAKNTVPVLRHGGIVIQGSSAIVHALPGIFGARRLEPPASLAAASEQLEALADEAFGCGVQKIAYAAFLPERQRMIELWSLGRGPWAKLFYGVTYPWLAWAVKRMYRLSPAEVERAKAAFRRALVRTDELLSSNPFLLGQSLTRADVCVAALIAPLLSPPEHEFQFAPFPAALQDFVDELESGPTARHVRRLYRDYRSPPSPQLGY